MGQNQINLTKRQKIGFLFIIPGILVMAIGFAIITCELEISSSFSIILLALGCISAIIGFYFMYTNPTDQKQGKFRVILVGIFVCIIALIGAFYIQLNSTHDHEKRGDGITTCKNCGKEEVVAFGMCEKCANGFLDWHDKLD